MPLSVCDKPLHRRAPPPAPALVEPPCGPQLVVAGARAGAVAREQPHTVVLRGEGACGAQGRAGLCASVD